MDYYPRILLHLPYSSSDGVVVGLKVPTKTTTTSIAARASLGVFLVDSSPLYSGSEGEVEGPFDYLMEVSRFQN